MATSDVREKARLADKYNRVNSALGVARSKIESPDTEPSVSQSEAQEDPNILLRSAMGQEQGQQQAPPSENIDDLVDFYLKKGQQ